MSNISYNADMLRFAADHDRGVTFRYAKGEKQAILEDRRVKPIAVSEHPKTKAFMVLGYDLDRDNYRSYRLDRVLGDVVITPR